MKENVRDQLQMCLCRAAVGCFAIGAVAAGTVHARLSNTVVVDPPTELPASARQTGEAMLLRETVDGRVLHHIEQNQGTRVATFDVADPAHMLDSPGVRTPKLMRVEGLTLPGLIPDAGTNAFTITSPVTDAPLALDFGAIDTVLSYELNRMFDVKQVRARLICDQASGRRMDSSVDGNSP
jgi:hypothetical protein